MHEAGVKSRHENVAAVVVVCWKGGVEVRREGGVSAGDGVYSTLRCTSYLFLKVLSQVSCIRLCIAVSMRQVQRPGCW